MDFVIDVRSRTKPFVLIPMDGIASMAKYFGRMFGVKLAAFKGNNRPPLPTLKNLSENMRRMQPDWPLLSEVVHAVKNDTEKSGDRGVAVVNAAIKNLERLKQMASPSQRVTDLHKQYETTGMLSPAQLLYAFKEVFVLDEVDLHFNYLEFFRTCFMLMLHVSQGHDDDTSVTYKVAYSILWDAADCSQATGGVHGSSLHEFGIILEALVEEQGDKWLKDAQAKSRVGVKA